MTKLDLAKTDSQYYKATKKPQVVELGSYPYLQIIGKGATDGEFFHQAIGAIYDLAFTLKFTFKEQNQDFVVPKLEAFWWVESGIPFNETPQSEWQWKICMRMPDFVDAVSVSTAINSADHSKNAALASVFFSELNEGKCLQAMHTGPYNEQGPTNELIMNFATENGLTITGVHHEIYISDPRRTKPDNLKTIIRYSVA